MRVLLPRFHNNGKDEETADGTAGEGQVLEEYELETFPVSETTHEATNQEGEGISSSSSSSSSSFHFLDTLDEQNQTTDDSQFEIPLGHRKRIACFTASTGGSSPKKVCVSNKKPPPSQLDTIDSKMTAPRFLEEERDAEEHPTNHNEVLENEPPVPSVASACRNFPVAPEDDPALMPVSRNYDDDNAFVQALKKKGLEIVEQAGDGNCLFRAVSLQVYGDASMHAEVRTRCMDFMAVNEEHFGEFVTGETYTEYIARKRLDGVHGNNPEIQAISELYNRPVEVYTPDRGAAPLNIFHKEYSTADIPIRLAYHDGNHYNAVIDPIRPTAGLGLGLPGLQPGLADKQQMQTAVLESDQQMDLEKAIKESEQELTHAYDDELQRALKESSESMAYMYKQKALALSDLDATSLEMEQTALESSLQSYMQTELGRKKRASPENKSSRTRQRNSPPTLPVYAPSAAAAAAASPAPAAAAAMSYADPSTASAGYTAHEDSSPDEYPAVVQELVMNGFELSKVVRAYELIGDNFDNLLSFLCSNGGYS